MQRLIALAAAGLLALSMVAAAATSLSVSQARTPAQGTATVSGACLTGATVAYTYAASDGTTAATPESGLAVYVRQIVVTRSGGASATCDGTTAHIAFANTSGTTSPVLATATPAYSSGTWTFVLDTTGAEKARNEIANWAPGAGITITIY